MVEAFVSFAVEKLGDFFIQEVSLCLSLREDVLWLRNELLFMPSFLNDAEEKQSEDQRVQQWVFEINSVASDAVAILETYNFEAGKGDDDRFASCLKACTCICRKEAKFYNVSKEIQSLKQRIMDISRKRETYGIRDINNTGERPRNRPNNRSAMARTLRRTTSYVDEEQIFVGFQDVVERLLAELLKAEPRRGVISIYGIGGAEDRVIYAENIIWLWMAEGFIPNGEERAEDVTEDFLNGLIRRSLIKVVDSFWKKVIKCRIHDLLRDLAVQKALEVNFFDICDPRKQSISSLCLRHVIHDQAQKYLSLDLSNFKLRSIMFYDQDFCQIK
ncbi:disease resistance protein RPP13-like isoform X1 [Lycium barbarum]|uniref:disease resistance protein RPP13-like isoform X1 n=1 Tax=Lycium barbarum TaxID=112863 RepID=UPI00293EEFE9|nr:disease resistance protein RPP13-like isoform X1 [Lycium barbarum]